MKKKDNLHFRIVVPMLFLMSLGVATMAQKTFYRENFGSPTATTLIQNFSGWQDDTVIYTGDGTCDVRSSSASSGYTGASGGGNVMINDTVKWFQISKINTSAAEKMLLYCGLRKTSSENGSNFVVEVSADSVTWSRLSMKDSLPSGTGTNGWYRVCYPNVPVCENLHIRFSNLACVDYRLDDIALWDGEETPIDSTAITTYEDVAFCAYPNPTQGSVMLYDGGLQIRTLSLCDLTGKELNQWSGEVRNISLSGLPMGTYILKAYTAEGVYVKKLVKY